MLVTSSGTEREFESAILCGSKPPETCPCAERSDQRRALQLDLDDPDWLRD